MNITTATVIRATAAAIRSITVSPGGGEGDSDAWHSIRNAVLRAARRQLGLPRHGHAPEWLFSAACDYADAAYFMRGWSSSFLEAATGFEAALVAAGYPAASCHLQGLLAARAAA